VDHAEDATRMERASRSRNSVTKNLPGGRVARPLRAASPNHFISGPSRIVHRPEPVESRRAPITNGRWLHGNVSSVRLFGSY